MVHYWPGVAEMNADAYADLRVPASGLQSHHDDGGCRRISEAVPHLALLATAPAHDCTRYAGYMGEYEMPQACIYAGPAAGVAWHYTAQPHPLLCGGAN